MQRGQLSAAIGTLSGLNSEMNRFINYNNHVTNTAHKMFR